MTLKRSTTIEDVTPKQRVRLRVGKRYVQLVVTHVENIGQGMVNVYYRNSEVPYRVPANTEVTFLGEEKVP